MSILNKMIFALMLWVYFLSSNAALITANGNSDSTYEYALAPPIFLVLRENSIDRYLNIRAFVAKVDPSSEHEMASISKDIKKDDPSEGAKANMADKGNNLPEVTPVPLPQAIWLFGAGLFGLLSVAKRKKIM